MTDLQICPSPRLKRRIFPVADASRRLLMRNIRQTRDTAGTPKISLIGMEEVLVAKEKSFSCLTASWSAMSARVGIGRLR